MGDEQLGRRVPVVSLYRKIERLSVWFQETESQNFIRCDTVQYFFSTSDDSNYVLHGSNSCNDSFIYFFSLFFVPGVLSVILCILIWGKKKNNTRVCAPQFILLLSGKAMGAVQSRQEYSASFISSLSE